METENPEATYVWLKIQQNYFKGKEPVMTLKSKGNRNTGVIVKASPVEMQILSTINKGDILGL